MLSSTSSGLSVDIVGENHYKTVIAAQNLLKKGVSLERIVSLVGESELSQNDQNLYRRSRIMKNYMTQNFFVIEPQSGKPGSFVPVEQTVADVKSILDGDYDSREVDEFLFIGSLKEISDGTTKQQTKL